MNQFEFHSKPQAETVSLKFMLNPAMLDVVMIEMYKTGELVNIMKRGHGGVHLPPTYREEDTYHERKSTWNHKKIKIIFVLTSRLRHFSI